MIKMSKRMMIMMMNIAVKIAKMIVNKKKIQYPNLKFRRKKLEYKY